MLKTIRSWWQDKLLRGVLKNTSYLFSSNSLSAALGMVNSIFVVRLLGVDGLGLVTTVQTFVSNINRFLSFRMSEVVVKYLGQALANNPNSSGEPVLAPESSNQDNIINQQAAAIVKGIGLLEACHIHIGIHNIGITGPMGCKCFAKRPFLGCVDSNIWINAPGKSYL